MEPENQAAESPARARPVLLASVFAVAACGLVYELVAGAISSYLLGDAVTQFSLVVGVFLCAMGLGSYLSKFITKRLLEVFVELEIWIGLVGGLSSVFMFAVNAYAAPVFPVIFYVLCALIGTMVGLEIPLLVRILKDGSGVTSALSHVLALDYVGALAGALAFPLLVLPLLGLSRASVVFGIMNLAVAGAGIALLKGDRRFVTGRLAAASVLLAGVAFAAPGLTSYLEDLLYQDSIVFSRDSRYQHIVITRWRDDVRLFLNGHLQFSSVDESRYHEALVIPAMEAAADKRSVLILGGGDGLAAREVLKYGRVQSITLVDLDPEMTRLGRERPELLKINGGSLKSPKVRVVSDDAMRFLEGDRGFYDVIIADLPDPSSETLSKLYSLQFYELAFRRLSGGGVFVTQATSPFYAREAFWCIKATMSAASQGEPAAAVGGILSYHADVPSFGDWGFLMLARRPVSAASLSVSVPARFLRDDVMRAMFVFGSDIAELPSSVNRLDDPVLYRLHKRGWERFDR
jgi:spermidine synthase